MKKKDKDYENWIESLDVDDSELKRKWFNCPEEKRADFLQNHPDFLTKTLWDE